MEKLNVNIVTSELAAVRIILLLLDMYMNTVSTAYVKHCLISYSYIQQILTLHSYDNIPSSTVNTIIS